MLDWIWKSFNPKFRAWIEKTIWLNCKEIIWYAIIAISTEDNIIFTWIFFLGKTILINLCTFLY